jgi:hypothetical protein
MQFHPHKKCSFRNLIPFLPFLLSYRRLPSPEWLSFLQQLHKWILLEQNSLNFDNSQLKWPSLSLYKPSTRTTQKTQPLYCRESLFTDPLPSNESPILARVRFRGNMFTESLPSSRSIPRSCKECENTTMSFPGSYKQNYHHSRIKLHEENWRWNKTVELQEAITVLPRTSVDC